MQRCPNYSFGGLAWSFLLLHSTFVNLLMYHSCDSCLLIEASIVFLFLDDLGYHHFTRQCCNSPCNHRDIRTEGFWTCMTHQLRHVVICCAESTDCVGMITKCVMLVCLEIKVAALSFLGHHWLGCCRWLSLSFHFLHCSPGLSMPIGTCLLGKLECIIIFALKRPTLTKSASSSSSDNRVDLVASRDDGKSPRGQD